MVHGNCVFDGCYAMTDEKIEEIYMSVEGALQKGQKYVQVHAFPFPMTDTAMALYSDSEWYDYFEVEHLPPYIKVANGLYTIHEANE